MAICCSRTAWMASSIWLMTSSWTASRLRAAGYPKTWALRGGYEAWAEHNHAV